MIDRNATRPWLSRILITILVIALAVVYVGVVWFSWDKIFIIWGYSHWVLAVSAVWLLRDRIDGVMSTRQKNHILEDRDRLAQDLRAVRKALSMLGGLLALSSRDWSATDVDARLYAVLCGWDETDDDDPVSDDRTALNIVTDRYHWSSEVVARLQELRTAVRTVTR